MMPRVEVAQVAEHKRSVAKMVAKLLLAGGEVGASWRAQLEAADTIEKVQAVRDCVLREIADRNRAEGEEYRRTGIRPARLEER